MKKFFALLIALLMVATLVACANDDDTGNSLETLDINNNNFSNNDVGAFTYEVSAEIGRASCRERVFPHV